MAKDKKSFLLYCDIRHTVTKMPDDKAGQLFKHILDYVNDLNPQTDDLIIQLTFEPIKQQLKRDLLKYECIRNKRIEAGLASAEKRLQNQQVLTSVESVQQSSTNSTVNDNVNVSVNVNDNKEKESVFSFKNELKSLGVKTDVISDWLKVRKNKNATNSKIAFEAIKKKIEESGMTANQCITIAVEKSWSGFDVKWLNGKTNEIPKSEWKEKILPAI